jgi:hypothetical protein
MSYNKIDYFDSILTDAFNNLKVSSSNTLFEVKQNTDAASKNALINWQVNGSGTSGSYSSQRSSTTLGVSANTAGTRAIQTCKRVNYQPGKSITVLVSAVIGDYSSGIEKKIGLFDENNGIYFKFANNQVNLVLRSDSTGTVTEEIVERSYWNGDPLNKTGKLKVNIDYSKAQIFGISFEWLGVGIANCFHFVDGKPVILHRFNLVNTRNLVYMRTPALPIRAEIMNTGIGKASSLEIICGVAQSDGGYDTYRSGINRSVFCSKIIAAANVNFYQPLICLRLKSSCSYSEIVPLYAFCSVETINSFYFGIAINNSPISGDNASWVSFPDSNFEYDISRTVNLSLNMNDILYTAIGSKNSGSITNNFIDDYWSLADIPNSSYKSELILFSRLIAATTNETFNASVNFKELMV